MAYVKGQPFKPQFTDPATNTLMSNGTIEFYLTGTSTPTPFYTDSAGTSGGTSLTLDSGGKPSTDIFYDTDLRYKLVIKNAAGGTVDTLEPYLAGGHGSTKSFSTIAEAVADTNLVIGDLLSIDSYTATSRSGIMFGRVVAASTGTVDGGKYINLTGSGLQFEQNMPSVINTALFGVDEANTDNSTHLQAAIDYAQSLNTLGGLGWQNTPVVKTPAGRYSVAAELTVTATKEIIFCGESMQTTVFNCRDAAAPFRSVITTTSTQSRFSIFRDFAIFGDYEIEYGIYAPNTEHAKYIDVRVSGTTEAAIYHTYGWSSVFERLELASNSGHGLYLDSNVNASSVADCQIYGNSGLGIFCGSSHSLQIRGGTIENNEQGGMMLNACSGVDINAYFEGNATVGYTFTTPAVTIGADIIFNGSSSPLTTLSTAYPCHGANLGASFGSSVNDVDKDCVVYAGSIKGLTIDSRATRNFSATPIPLIKTSATSTVGAIEDVFVRGAVTHSDSVSGVELIEIDDLSSQMNRSGFSTLDFSSVVSLDAGLIYGSDPTAYTQIYSATSTLSTTLHSDKKDGVALYESVQNIDGSSEGRGFTFDLTDVETYADKYWYALVLVKQGVGSCGFTLSVDDGDTTFINSENGSALSSGWKVRCVPFKANGTGTVRVTVRHIGGTASDSCIWTRPIVAPIGMPSTRFGVSVKDV